MTKLTIVPDSKRPKLVGGETGVAGVKVVDHEVVMDRLEAAWNEQDAKRPERFVSGNWHASSLVDCTRKEGYARLGVPKTNRVAKSDWRLAAEIGDVIHAAKQRQMVDAGMILPLLGHRPRDPRLPRGWAIECDIARCCDPAMLCELQELRFSGRVDAVWVLKDGTLAVADIKTTDAKDFDQTDRYFKDKLYHWAMQLRSYSHFFMAPDGRLARKAYILQIDRGNTSRQRMYRVDYDEAGVLAEFDRIRSAEVLIGQGKLPEPQPERGICFFCQHRSLCERDRKMVAA